MAYVKQSWKDGKDGGTPISAARLNHIEDGIASVPAGPKGADGFPTRAQWDALVARVTALEGKANP